MGLAADEKAGRTSSSSNAEETLPLYEDSQREILDADLSPPEPKATPDEVRDFLVAVMRARGIHMDHARRVAAKWQLGTGSELRNYPVGMFRDIFGAEDGWVVYEETRVRYYAREMKPVHVQRGIATAAIILPAALVIGAILIFTMNGLESAFVFLLAACMLAVGFISLVFAVTMATTNGVERPEGRVARDLKFGWGRAAGGPQ